MLTELEKLDEIRSRVRVSYEEAKRALDQSGGDVVAAIVALEGKGQDMLSLGVELLDDVQKLIDSGTPRSVRLKFGDRLIKEYPVALGVAAAFAVGMLAVVISKASIEIECEEEDAEGA